MLAILDLNGKLIGTIAKGHYNTNEPLGYFLLWSDYIVVENYQELTKSFT